MLWADNPLQRRPLGKAGCIPPWGRGHGSQMKLKVVRERGGAVTPASRTVSNFRFPPLVPSPLPSSASGGGVCFEGESKCIWPQHCLPRWVAMRLDCVTLDCVTPSSSAQDRSVHPRTHAYPLPPTIRHDTLRGARPQRGSQHWKCHLSKRVNLSERDRPWESVKKTQHKRPSFQRDYFCFSSFLLYHL